jgi:hypothetical protein
MIKEGVRETIKSEKSKLELAAFSVIGNGHVGRRLRHDVEVEVRHSTHFDAI